MDQEVGAPLLKEVPAEEGACAKGCASLAAWARGVLASYAISIATLAICSSCALPTADFATDVGFALPKYLEKGLLESFEVQLAAIAAGVLLGYVEFVRSYGLWQKLSVCPVWLRCTLMTGGLLAFPLAPLFVTIAALVGFANGNEVLLSECGEAVPVVVSGEFFEALAGLALQLKTYVFDAVDVRVSLVIGFLSSTKAALRFDLESHKHLILTMSTGTGDDAGVDRDFAVVTGLLPGVAADLHRSALLVLHRASEIASGVCCAVCFHRMAYGGLSVEVLGRKISMAGPAFYLAQVLLAALQHGLRRQTERFWRAFVVPLTVPLPLLDAFYGSAAEHSTRACAQAVVAILWATSHVHRTGWYVQAGVTDETTWSACLSAAGLTSALMWVTLAGIRALPATPLEEHSARVAAECAELCARGAHVRKFASSVARQEWNHPCAVSFRRRWLQTLAPRSCIDAEAGSLVLHAEDLRSVGGEALRSITQVSSILTTLTSLQLDLSHNDTITGDGLKAAIPLTLTSLQLGLWGSCKITNDGLKAAIPHTLTSLQLDLRSNDNITGDGLKAAIPPTLASLQLGLGGNCNITDNGLKAAIPHTLTSLQLALWGNCKITNDGLKAAIPPTLTSLQLDLRSNDNITGDGLKAAIPHTLTSLQLYLYSNDNITNDGLKAAIPPTLTSLQLDLGHNRKITDNGLKAAIPPTLTSLHLDLWDNGNITNDGLKAAIPPTLTSLQLCLGGNHCKITGDGLKAAIPPTLTSLQLALPGNGKITNDGLKAAIPPTLASLQLSLWGNCKITNDGLKAAIPRTLISLQLDLRSNDNITGDGLKAAIPRTLTSLQLDLRSNDNITGDGLTAAIPPALRRLQLTLSLNSEITAERLRGSPHLQIGVRYL